MSRVALLMVVCMAALCGFAASSSGATPGARAGERGARESAAPRKRCSRKARRSRRSCARPRRCAKRRGKRTAAKRRRRCRKAARGAPGAQGAPESGTSPTTPGARGPLGSPGGGGGGPLGRYLSVSASEFRLTLSRPALAAGAVTIELRNVGEDPHNLVISPDDGSHAYLAGFPETASGGVDAQGLQLQAGRYYLWCSLEGHEAAGMSARLRVE